MPCGSHVPVRSMGDPLSPPPLPDMSGAAAAGVSSGASSAGAAPGTPPPTTPPGVLAPIVIRRVQATCTLDTNLVWHVGCGRDNCVVPEYQIEDDMVEEIVIAVKYRRVDGSIRRICDMNTTVMTIMGDQLGMQTSTEPTPGAPPSWVDTTGKGSGKGH